MTYSDRRKFIKTIVITSVGLSLTPRLSWAGNSTEPEAFILSQNGWVPNNQKLPVLHYRKIITDGDVATLMETMFNSNNWIPQWRNGIYDYHHYHSTAHEVLGFAGGSARLMLGGPNGHEVEVNKGDVVLLPAGTGHCRISATDDFLVVGSYPEGQNWDICREAPTAQMKKNMSTLPFPTQDPVNGDSPPLTKFYKTT